MHKVREGEGNDLLYGNLGVDRLFVGAGADMVGDFSDDDRIEIAANLTGTTIDSLADLKAVARGFGGNVIFGLGSGNSLILIGVQTADLRSEWFSVG